MNWERVNTRRRISRTIQAKKSARLIAATVIVAIVSLAFCVSCTSMPGGGTPPPGGTPPLSGTVDSLIGPRLLVIGAGKIVTLRRDASLDGIVTPAMVLEGDAADLGSPQGMVVNGAGELVVVCDQTDASRENVSINVYADATRLNGDQAPARQVTATGIPTRCIDDIALDVNRDVLYILCELLSGSITVYAFDGTSSSGFDGEMAPTRALTIDEMDTATQLFVTPDDTLYVAGSSEVLALDMASTRSGAAVSDRQIIGFGGALVFGLWIDPNDTFYALSINGSRTVITRVANFSNVEGDAMVLSSIEVLDTSFEKELVLDVEGNAYFSAAATVQVFDNVASLDGPQSPTRQVTSDVAQLGGTGDGDGRMLVID